MNAISIILAAVAAITSLGLVATLLSLGRERARAADLDRELARAQERLRMTELGQAQIQDPGMQALRKPSSPWPAPGSWGP